MKAIKFHGGEYEEKLVKKDFESRQHSKKDENLHREGDASEKEGEAALFSSSFSTNFCPSCIEFSGSPEPSISSFLILE